MLGAVVYETGGVSIADGLIRLLGSGLGRSLQQAQEKLGIPLDRSYADMLIIADDILGGLFALNGGRFGSDHQGELFHLAADGGAWAPLGMGYGSFVQWCLSSHLHQLYDRFSHFEAFELRPRPSFDETYSFYPFLWTEQAWGGKPDVRLVSASEVMRFRIDLFGYAIEQ
jgi:hypothetical protein